MKILKFLRDELPSEALEGEYNHLDKYKDLKILETIEKYDPRFPFSHKNIHIWWILEGNIAVGWNENPSRGWSFPVKKISRS